jgi:hypothetical protein
VHKNNNNIVDGCRLVVLYQTVSAIKVIKLFNRECFPDNTVSELYALVGYMRQDWKLEKMQAQRWYHPQRLSESTDEIRLIINGRFIIVTCMMKCDNDTDSRVSDMAGTWRSTEQKCQ